MDKRLLPEFELPSTEGSMVSIDQYLQRRELLIALLHGGDCEDCQRFAQGLAEKGDLRGAVALAIFDRAPEKSVQASDVHWLIDETGDVSRKLRAVASVPVGAASLLASDRFGVLYAAQPIHGQESGRALEEALGWIDFIQMQCPECGVPVW